MASVNRVTLIGNLGKDPETRFLPDGKAVANFSNPTTDRGKDKATGEQKEATEWHRISAFGRLAEIVGEYLKKGSAVYIEGKLKTRKWQDKDGQDRYTTEIIADSLQMLGSRGGSGENGQQESKGGAQPESRRTQSGPAAGGAKGSFADMDDDIPF